MEEAINEMEYDEFEKLLGEIPNVTSSNSYSDEYGAINGPTDLRRVPLALDRPNYIGDRMLGEGKESGNRVQQPADKRVDPEETNLANKQAITSAFADLRITDGTLLDSAAPPLPNSTVFLNHLARASGQCTNGIGILSSNVDPRLAVISSPRAQNSLSSVFNGFSPNIEENNGYQSRNSHAMGNISAAVPLPSRGQGVHLFSSMPIHQVDIPVISDQQHYYFDTASSLPYLHSQVNQPHLACRNIEDEQFYMMHQQYLYMQQLRNQQLDCQRHIQANGRVTSRSLNRRSRQPVSEMPIPCSNQQFNQDSSWDKAIFSRSLNPNSQFCTMDSDAMQVLDKADKHCVPEIILRTHGLDSVKSVKFDSTGGSPRLSHVYQNGRVFPSAYLNSSYSAPSAEFHLGCLSSSLDAADIKFNLRSQLQKYNSIDEFAGRIYFMAKDQNGCRLLQRKFAEGTSEDVDTIFPEIIVHIVELMIDPFGNYLIQKLLDVCNEDQRLQILHAITRKRGDLLRISCDVHGTRAVQKVIETLRTPEQFSIIVSSLKPGLVSLIKNMNGNHVAQRCLQYLRPEYREASGLCIHYLLQFNLEV